MFKQPNPCSNQEICVLFEYFLLENPKDGPRFICMTLCLKTLRHGMSILSMVLLMSTLLAEMTSLTFDFVC